MPGTRFTICLLAALSLLLSAMAVAQDGQYLILNAQYGNERNHVDVTGRLRELARHEQRFHVNHESMEADPDHGHAKVLRVFARDSYGQERMFEFADGNVLEGAQFRDWGRGNWGNERWDGGWNGHGDAGQYLILSAQYGNERHHVDVTDRLKDMARQDRVFRLDYRTFGVDPDEGHAKSLRIFARGPHGRERMFEYQDNSIIDGAKFRGWGSGDWGTGWSGNWNVNRPDEGEFLILSAQYGSERHHVDVTNRLKDLARQDRQFRLDYRTFNVDPDEGRTKVLRIYARGANGREHMFESRDGSLIDGSIFRGWDRGEWAGPEDRWSGRWEGEERDRDRD